jgi:hypothetical protein
VSEARPREERGPRPPGQGGYSPGGGGGFGGPRPSGGGFSPRPAPGGGFGPRPGGAGGGPPGSRDRSANFGPPAPPKRLRGKKGSQQEHKPRGPIKERSGGRIYAVDDLEDDSSLELEDAAAVAEKDDELDDTAATPEPDDELEETPPEEKD